MSELADRSGLTEALSVAMADCGISWHTHDPGVVVSHLAVAMANGADCLSDLAALRHQDRLFGPVASQATAWRALQSVSSLELRGIAAACATARQKVWAARGVSLDALTLDFDATLVTAHSDKQDAAPTYKRGYGFHPFGVWLDETAEPLAAMLRPGNAGANDALDHIELLEGAIAALPGEFQVGHHRGDDAAAVEHRLLVRADSAGASHDFVDGAHPKPGEAEEEAGSTRHALAHRTHQLLAVELRAAPPQHRPANPPPPRAARPGCGPPDHRQTHRLA